MKPIRAKPHRLPKEAYKGHVIVSFTLCIANREALFTSPGVVEAFVDMLDRLTDRWSCMVLPYCFMPDHLHLVLHGTQPETDLLRAVADFKQKSGYWLYQNAPGISWQKDFHDHIIRRGDDLVAHVRYVLDNPCRKGLVLNWDDYPFKGSIGCELEDVLAGMES